MTHKNKIPMKKSDAFQALCDVLVQQKTLYRRLIVRHNGVVHYLLFSRIRMVTPSTSLLAIRDYQKNTDTPTRAQRAAGFPFARRAAPCSVLLSLPWTNFTPLWTPSRWITRVPDEIVDAYLSHPRIDFTKLRRNESWHITCLHEVAAEKA